MAPPCAAFPGLPADPAVPFVPGFPAVPSPPAPPLLPSVLSAPAVPGLPWVPGCPFVPAAPAAATTCPRSRVRFVSVRFPPVTLNSRTALLPSNVTVCPVASMLTVSVAGIVIVDGKTRSVQSRPNVTVPPFFTALLRALNVQEPTTFCEDACEVPAVCAASAATSRMASSAALGARNRRCNIPPG